MSEPYRATQSIQLVTGRGIIEVIALVSSASEASLLSIYDSEEGQGLLGRRLYDLAAVKEDSRVTPKLNIPYKYGIYASLSGAGAQTIVTVN